MKEDIAIKVSSLSKKYEIGKSKDSSLRGSLSNVFKSAKAEKDEFWALKNLNFEVKKGDVVGIIGKNGAGKSTLLKVLSQITKPTEGRVEINGRVASLLEVGTGFHPELTGRENVYLNGTILGMSRKEVSSKFDEIVEFSGVQKFIDTPVKHYSSGMYVRLAFAVAAYLEPEILIIDEVLAVGDIEFQKKCLGKMKDVAGQGRTVLFVSHNMGAVNQLCNSGVFLNHGKIEFSGSTDDTIQYYLNSNSNSTEFNRENDEQFGNENIQLIRCEASPLDGTTLAINSGIELLIEFENFVDSINLDCTLEITNSQEVIIYHKGILLITDKSSRKGVYCIKLTIPPSLLNEDIYKISLIFGKDQKYLLYNIKDIIQFEILGIGSVSSSKRPGIIYSNFKSTIDFHET